MKSSKKTCGCCWLFGAPTEESLEEARKFREGEWVMYEINRPSKSVPEIGVYDEVICSTTQVPVEGDVVTIRLWYFGNMWTPTGRNLFRNYANLTF